MPRKSAAALSVVTPIIDRRPKPPEDMPEAQIAIWQRIVQRLPHDWFKAEHQEILRAYCQHAAIAQTLAKAIESFDPEWLYQDDGLKRFDDLGRALDREHRAMLACARSMRLTHQSQYHPRTAAGQARGGLIEGREPWKGIP